MIRLIFAPSLFAAFLFSGCGSELLIESGTTKPHRAYQSTISNQIPAGISNLQGGAETWQGYRVSLRFNASNAIIDDLIATALEREAS